MKRAKHTIAITNRITKTDIMAAFAVFEDLVLSSLELFESFGSFDVLTEEYDEDCE